MIGVSAVNIVKSNRDLRDNLQPSFPGLENLCVNLVAQSRDESINSRAHLFYNHTFRRGRRIGMHFNLIPALAQSIKRISNVAGGKNAKGGCHVLGLSFASFVFVCSEQPTSGGGGELLLPESETLPRLQEEHRLLQIQEIIGHIRHVPLVLLLVKSKKFLNPFDASLGSNHAFHYHRFSGIFRADYAI